MSVIVTADTLPQPRPAPADVQPGLSEAEAADRLARFGRNQLPPPTPSHLANVLSPGGDSAAAPAATRVLHGGDLVGSSAGDGQVDNGPGVVDVASGVPQMSFPFGLERRGGIPGTGADLVMTG
ncbi:MAG: hypothetical protein JWN00_509 [Actinomycetia bacterium]|nr:hypothetical protein [Actinomycetes bacterium]